MAALQERYRCRDLYSSRAPKRFVRKFINVQDPLNGANNLGRSVSYSNFLRIRKALAKGASEMAAVLEHNRALDAFRCERAAKGDRGGSGAVAAAEERESVLQKAVSDSVSNFFKHTLRRHGKGEW